MCAQPVISQMTAPPATVWPTDACIAAMIPDHHQTAVDEGAECLPQRVARNSEGPADLRLLGRKRTIQLFAVLSIVFMVAYTRVPAGSNTIILWLGFPLGFCASAIFSGFGSYLSELYPADVRGTGQGFTYNFGRAVGAVFPTAVGFLASSTLGLNGAMLFGALGYVVAALALSPGSTASSTTGSRHTRRPASTAPRRRHAPPSSSRSTAND